MTFPLLEKPRCPLDRMDPCIAMPGHLLSYPVYRVYLDRNAHWSSILSPLCFNGKAVFWDKHAGKATNGRQRLMLNKLLDGFEGKLNTSKWAKFASAEVIELCPGMGAEQLYGAICLL